MTLAKRFVLQEFSKIFHNIENTKNKMMEADPNLERAITVRQGIEKTLPVSEGGRVPLLAVSL